MSKKEKHGKLPKTAPKRTGKRGVGPKPESDEPQGELIIQAELPGMEERHLEDLEDAARNYARVRDRRMALNREEFDLKELLLQIMKRHEKQVYRVAEMEIKIVAKEETVKVKLLEDED